MPRDDTIVLEKSMNMDWGHACELVEKAVHLFASNTARADSFSPEAVNKSIEIEAAWRRIQRG